MYCHTEILYGEMKDGGVEGNCISCSLTHYLSSSKVGVGQILL